MLLYFLFIFTTVSSQIVIHTDDYCYHLICKNVVNRKEQIKNKTTLCPWSKHTGHVNNNTECLWNNSLQYELIKNYTGLILIKFDYPTSSCNYTKFCTVELYVEDGTDGEKLHSSVYSVNFENYKITAVFKYVFSGTYFIKINDLRSTKIHINTQYTLKEIDNKSYNIRDHSEHVNKNLKFTVNFEPSYFLDEVPEMLIGIRCKDILPKESSNNTCNSSIVSDNTSLSCYYENIEPRTYRFELDILDDVRCNTQSIFCKNKKKECCKFLTYITIHNITSNLEDNNTSFAWHGFVVVLFVVVLIIIVVVILIYKKYFKYRTPLRTTRTYVQVQKQDYNQTFEILLLYARDAEVFTKMITAFKNLIQTDNSVIVSDIYDFDGKNVDPMRWLEEKLVSNSTKVILFLNECAPLIYEHGTNIYREPHCFDHLFKHSLVFLINSRERISYKNIFVAKLYGISHDNGFNILNPSARYQIPQHINKLLNDVWSMEEKKVDKLLLNEFKKKCIDCFKFYENNNDYLYTLLNVEQNNLEC